MSGGVLASVPVTLTCLHTASAICLHHSVRQPQILTRSPADRWVNRRRASLAAVQTVNGTFHSCGTLRYKAAAWVDQLQLHERGTLWHTHTQDKIDRNVKVRTKLKVFFFSHLLHKCITYLSLFFCKQKKVFTIQPCRDQAQTCQQDYICRFLYLPVYSPGDAVCAAHAPTRSFAAQKKTRRRCTYHTVGDCESVPDAMYAIVMETFQVIV